MSRQSGEPESRSRGLGFWLGQGVGIVVVSAGVRGLLDERLGAPPSFARFFVGSVLVHDLVLAPLVFAGAWLVKRAVPAWTWPTVRNALFVSVVCSLFSYPFIRGFGRRSANGTVLPRDYAEGLLLVLGTVWLIAATWLAARRLRQPQPVSAADASTARISSP